MPAPAQWTDRFTRTRELGRGAMGVVHAADDRVLRRPVAVKSLPRPDLDEVVALKREFRARQGLHHPNLVTLYELFADSDDCFFTMELVDGPPLGQALAAAIADPLRARALVAQFVHGLAAIHDAGLLHRDIKPSNVLTDRDGRVVILDFGLAMSVRDAEHTREVSGTLDYLAPEAIWGRSSPASDWFSAGALLYEAVRGRLPWHPERLEQRFVRVDVAAELPPNSWPWLVELIAKLLAPTAEARPTGDELRRLLPLAGTAPAVATLRPALVGRDRELAVLRENLAALRDDLAAAPRDDLAAALRDDLAAAPRDDLAAALRDDLAAPRTRRSSVVWLRGPSGAGKSRLLAKFLDEAQASGDVVVLRGVCHYTEHLTLPALDPLMDELARVLRSPLLARAADAPPPGPAALLFPALADPGQPPTLALPPAELRSAALQALRDLLRQVASHKTLVLAIDDIQWGDSASAQILRDLLDHPDAPPLMLLLAIRADQAPGEFAATLSDWHPPAGTTQSLTLGPLALADAAALLQDIHPAVGSRAEELARLADGSPFLVLELARADLARDPETPDPTGEPAAPDPTGEPVAPVRDLAALLHRRIAALDPRARKLAHLTALSARPLPRTIAFAAADAVDDGFLLALTLERSSVLVNQPGAEPGLGVYHDQLRRALVDDLLPRERSDLHADLADAYEHAAASDPEALLPHLLGSGRHTRAITVAVDAATRASERLAFERATSLLQIGLDAGATGAQRVDILRRQGEAWRNCGLGSRAAEVFRSAAALAEQHTAQAHADALWADAAEELVRHGNTAAGEAIFRRLLAAAGVRIPTRSPDAMALGLGLRLRLWWRGYATTPREDHTVDPHAHRRQELLWKATNSLSLSRFPLAFFLNGRLLREALDHGGRSHLVRSLGTEASFAAGLGGAFFARRAAALLAHMDAAAGVSPGPLVEAGLRSFHAIVAWNRGRWRDAAAACDAFCTLVRRDLPGHAWGLAVMEVHACSALYHLGELDALADRVPQALAAARARGDTLAINHFRLGDPGCHVLARGDIAAARLALREAEREISLGPNQDTYYYTLLRVQTELAERRPDAAAAALAELWPQVKAGQFLAMEMARCFLHHLHARVILARLADKPGPRPRTKLLRDLDRSTAPLRRATVPAGPALAAHLDAARLRLTDQPASDAYRRAATLCEQADLLLMARTLAARTGGPPVHPTAAAMLDP